MGYLTSGPPLTRDEEEKLIPLAQAGDLTARNRLISGNIGLLMKLANRYRGQLDKDDVIQEMVFVMVRAIKGYKIGKKVRLTSYAARGFMRHLRRCELAMSYPVKLPSSAGLAALQKINGSDRPCRVKASTIDQAAAVLVAGRDREHDVVSPCQEPIEDAILREMRNLHLSLPASRFEDCSFWRSEPEIISSWSNNLSRSHHLKNNGS